MNKTNYVPALEALSILKPGMRIFAQGSACTPLHLFETLAQNAEQFTGLEFVSITLLGDIKIDRPEFASRFHINSMFVSQSIREAVNAGRADFTPIFLSDIHDLFRSGALPIDVAMIQVSPPDLHGYCSLGLSVDIARTAVNVCKQIIALVNPQMPRTHGDSQIHVSQFTRVVLHDAPLPEVAYAAKARPEDLKIGENIAALIEDRSTLQLGIGTIPDSALQCLRNHKDLGIHSEMVSNGVMELMELGVITNRYKKIHPHKVVTSFANGTQEFYRYLNDNVGFAFLDIDYVNDPHVIRRNEKMIAINSALEMDLTGQVCADSLGTYQYSGIGGQMDFIRGAALSPGGKPIIALSSRTKGGLSRIVPTLKPGAGVVTSRGHIHWVVTEYGSANLFGKSIRERAKLLTVLSHPDDREGLERAFHSRFKS